MYGFLGMIILDQTVRLRIAYSVKRFPKYDDSLNQTTILLISYGAYIYALVGSWLYSNQNVFENKVFANKSHSVYNSFKDHDLSDTLFTMTPGTLFVLTYTILGLGICLYLFNALFFFCCPKCDCLPKQGYARYWKLTR